ncbi:hypothetical protein FO519_007516 [Halicephalobus sp. NKZ332]|nr:hypothetical protein FO519_007516 [Halicephalobus sp. NKZ332]
MLRENLTSEDLDVAISETIKIPSFLNVHLSLKFQKSGGFPEASWRSFWFKNEEGKRVDFIVRKFLPLEGQYFLFVCSEPDIRLDKLQVFEAFDKLHKETDDMFDTKVPVIICFSPILELFSEWFQKTFADWYLGYIPCFYYYMTKNQMDHLLEDTKNGIHLPEGYYWDEADPERDIQTIFETWRYSRPADYEIMKAKIRNLPSSMIRVSGTGEPAAFELTDPCGYLNHLFTQPSHRLKGLGTATEKGICVKLIKGGMVPFKVVGTGNTNVVRSTDKNPYWTRWEDSEGKPILVTFIQFKRKG